VGDATLYACVFGSAARGDGIVDSDIDLLLVHPPFRGDPAPASTGILDVLTNSVAAMAAARRQTKEPDPEDDIRRDVQRWSGNALQVVDVSAVEWLHPTQGISTLRQAIHGSCIDLIKEPTFWAGS
jgi:hypothetical protein